MVTNGLEKRRCYRYLEQKIVINLLFTLLFTTSLSRLLPLPEARDLSGMARVQTAGERTNDAWNT
jgi:hypothetical protein